MTFIFLDTETTGLDVEKHEVWEIAYAIDDGPILTSFVKHDIRGADPKALEINGYVDRFHLENGWEETAIWENDLIDAAKGHYLVGSNPAFDQRFLVKRWGERPWEYRMIDIATYAMPYFGLVVPEGLAFITNALDIESGDHTAAKDVEVLRNAFYKLQDMYRMEMP